ncbi:SusC/RagA family TonB-linked outer membrane protein [Maribacter sp. 2307ULW6-5]|uniref:SusC/RagA family TonB-linked outer membrane protein n=1 Tax=Maribacter sp. 2307ULW6-5 TaxID=3386275 RepID=UPI0039BCEAA3
MKQKLTWMLTPLLALFISFSYAQEKTVSGTVTDQSGLPLPGVSIVVVGTTSGTQTDFDGNYVIRAAQGQQLRYTYLGQKAVTLTVGASNVMDLQMEEDAEALEEVVVVGYGEVQNQKMVQNVAQIGNDDIRDIPAVTAQELLQGQASGVQMVQSSGVLGSANVIRIRGVGSLTAGAQPLFVVDGVPLNDNDNTFNNGGNVGLNPLQDIAPEDIETFSVLKDAAASAIYGSRGANGVILITTKKGREGMTEVNVNMFTSFTQGTDFIPMQSADQARQYLVERGVAPTVGDLPQGSFNWVDGVTRTGISENANVSIRGGSKKTSFFMSAGYRDEQGFIIGNNLTRFSGRLNLDHQATDWLKVGMNIGITNTRNDRVGVENNTFAPLTSAYLILPWQTPFDDAGNLRNTGFVQNTIGIERLETRQVDNTRIIANAFANIDLTDNLFFRSEVGIDRVVGEEFGRGVQLFDPRPDGSPGGNAFVLLTSDNKWLTNQTLNFNDSFGDHTVSAVAGLSYETSLDNTIQAASQNFLSDDLRNVSSGGEATTTEQNRTQWSLFGLFGRVSYDYQSKYILEGSFRRDGSSRFGANRRYGDFWSVAGGWVLTEENFLNDVSWLDNLKLTASYGTSGNDRIGNFPSLGLFLNSAYNNVPGLRPQQASNPNIGWEESTTLDLGMSTSLFKNRINLSVNYFQRDVSNLLLNVPVTWLSGFGSIQQNAGRLNNRGWEFTLKTQNIVSNNFSWTTDFNISMVDPTVEELPGAAESEEGRFVAGSANQRAIEGFSPNTFYLVRYNGINPQTGDAEWLTKDGDVTTTPNFDTDRVVAGDANPDFFGGMTNTFRFKSWDLRAFMTYSVGNDIYLDGLRFTDAPSLAGSFNQSVRILDYWEQPGDQSYAPALGSSTNNAFRQASTLQMKDGSFLRLRNVTLGYNVPSRFLGNSFIKGLRFYGTANNVFVIKSKELRDVEGFDPEVTDSTNPLIQGETFFTAPQAKTYLLGARITF